MATRILRWGGLVLLLAWGAACGSAPCEATCSGCCDAQGICQPGNSTLACGSTGAQCTTCPPFQQCQLGACFAPPMASGGGSATGGGGGGGGATGGGTATGGGVATGGGSTGGGGGAACSPLIIPSQVRSSAFYTTGTNGAETSFSSIEWTDASGRNLLVLNVEWSLAPMSFDLPAVTTVTAGQLTSGWSVVFLWAGCTSDLAICAHEYLIYDGVVTVRSADRTPAGSIAASSSALVLQESDVNNNYVLPGRCLTVPARDWSATYVCNADGVSCSSASDCCSNVCQAGTCGVPPACRSNGTSCTSASQCCTGQCTAGVCGACRSDGISCTSASQCCTGQCSSGVCGAPACRSDGLSCTSASQCCTGQCSSGVCGAPVCRSNGTSCTSASQCCSAQCSSGVCGAPACRADGYSCTSASQCCTGSCAAGYCGFTVTSCDPVNNSGCPSGEGCWLLSSGTATCAVTGYGTQGSSCSASNPCAGGFGCFANTCRKICRTSTGQGCTGSSVCNGVSGWTTYGACT